MNKTELEELYQIQFIRIKELEAELVQAVAFASLFYHAIDADEWPRGAYQLWQAMSNKLAIKIDAPKEGADESQS